MFIQFLFSSSIACSIVYPLPLKCPVSQHLHLQHHTFPLSSKPPSCFLISLVKWLFLLISQILGPLMSLCPLWLFTLSLGDLHSSSELSNYPYMLAPQILRFYNAPPMGFEMSYKASFMLCLRVISKSNIKNIYQSQSTYFLQTNLECFI